jgi:hypothetical protein
MVINVIIKLSMPLAFSFFSTKSSGLPAAKQAEAGVASNWVPEVKPAASAFDDGIPAAADGDKENGLTLNPQGFSDDHVSLQADHKTQIINSPALPPRQEIALPARKDSAGFAAMVVNQSENAAPPLNRRPQSPFPVAPASPPSQTLFPSARPMTAPQTEMWHAAVTPSTEPLSYDVLKEELQLEIEQVKADLFGAAMGVSALKDRLEGVESLVAQQSVSVASSPVSREDIHAWISEWMDANLSAAVERALGQAQQKMMGALSTQDYFRQPCRLPHTDRSVALIHPPIILASTPL